LLFRQTVGACQATRRKYFSRPTRSRSTAA
jgi:hypothetical protein